MWLLMSWQKFGRHKDADLDLLGIGYFAGSDATGSRVDGHKLYILIIWCFYEFYGMFRRTISGFCLDPRRHFPEKFRCQTKNRPRLKLLKKLTANWIHSLPEEIQPNEIMNHDDRVEVPPFFHDGPI
jgi:hypothetical protein